MIAQSLENFRQDAFQIYQSRLWTVNFGIIRRRYRRGWLVWVFGSSLRCSFCWELYVEWLFVRDHDPKRSRQKAPKAYFLSRKLSNQLDKEFAGIAEPVPPAVRQRTAPYGHHIDNPSLDRRGRKRLCVPDRDIFIIG